MAPQQQDCHSHNQWGLLRLRQSTLPWLPAQQHRLVLVQTPSTGRSCEAPRHQLPTPQVLIDIRHQQEVIVRLFVSLLPAAGYSRVMVTASVASWVGNQGLLPYSASKVGAGLAQCAPALLQGKTACVCRNDLCVLLPVCAVCVPHACPPSSSTDLADTLPLMTCGSMSTKHYCVLCAWPDHVDHCRLLWQRLARSGCLSSSGVGAQSSSPLSTQATCCLTWHARLSQVGRLLLAPPCAFFLGFRWKHSIVCVLERGYAGLFTINSCPPCIAVVGP